MASLHQDLCATEGDRFFDLLIDLVVSDDVGVVLLLGAVERTELAVNVADIGVVDVAVNDVGDDVIASVVVGMCLGELATSVGERAEFFQRELGKTLCFFRVDAFAIPNFLEQRIKGVVSDSYHGPDLMVRPYEVPAVSLLCREAEMSCPPCCGHAETRRANDGEELDQRDVAL